MMPNKNFQMYHLFTTSVQSVTQSLNQSISRSVSHLVHTLKVQAYNTKKISKVKKWRKAKIEKNAVTNDGRKKKLIFQVTHMKYRFNNWDGKETYCLTKFTHIFFVRFFFYTNSFPQLPLLRPHLAWIGWSCLKH